LPVSRKRLVEELLPWNVAASLSPENRRSGVNKDPATKVGVGSSSELPHIAELIIDGEITVGTLVPVGCVAIAINGHNALAMLTRREGETLAETV